MEAWSQHPLEALQRTLCTSSSPRLHGKSDKFVLSRMLLALTFDGMKPQTVQIQHHRPNTIAFLLGELTVARC